MGGAGERLDAYALRQRIAVGGTAEIFLATEPRSVGAAREVVVKRMLPELATDALARAMFADEGRLGRRIQHPNVTRVLGGGEAQGLPYLVIEYVPGCDLFRFLRHLRLERSALSVDLGLYIARELVQGLAALHEATDERGLRLDVVHQDVSPTNILLSRFGDVKLADVGVARARLRSHFAGLPASERMKGQPAYFAPEQVAGQPADARSDVFSAATVAAELLLGRPLFDRGSELSTLLAVRDVDVSRLLEARARLPQRAVGAILQALAKDPHERTPSARAFAGELGRALTNDVAPMARELGDLVSIAAVDVGGGGGDGSTIRTTIRDEAPVLEESERMTLELTPSVYAVQRPTGREELSYAQMVERVATGTIPPSAEVLVDGGVPRPVSSIDELARHVPPSGRRSVPPPADARTIAFEAGGFARAFVHAIATEATGTFVCRRGTEQKEVSLSEGRPTYVGSNLAAEMLGEFLVARGVVNRGELDMALAVLHRYDGRLGDTLVALGLVDSVHLFREIGVQVRERLLDVFTWRSGTAVFEPDLVKAESSFPPDAEIFAVLDEAYRRRLLAGLEVPPLSAEPSLRVVRSRDSLPGFDPSRLPRAEKLIILRAKNPVDARGLLDDLGRDLDGDRGRADRALLILLAAGALHRA